MQRREALRDLEIEFEQEEDGRWIAEIADQMERELTSTHRVHFAAA